MYIYILYVYIICIYACVYIIYILDCMKNFAGSFYIFFLLTSITAVLYDGRQEERKAMKEELSGEGKFNVLITHYDLIMRDKQFLKKISWCYLIVDEGHRLKNSECALAITLAGYVDSC